jgi:hypothetical protein
MFGSTYVSLLALLATSQLAFSLPDPRAKLVGVDTLQEEVGRSVELSKKDWLRQKRDNKKRTSITAPYFTIYQ